MSTLRDFCASSGKLHFAYLVLRKAFLIQSLRAIMWHLMLAADDVHQMNNKADIYIH